MLISYILKRDLIKMWELLEEKEIALSEFLFKFIMYHFEHPNKLYCLGSLV